ncbi:DUF1254 domain-containing protein [Desulfogranum marinum]|uniref:DUF1254 domain-containing protein n=1 Tax=Desulfogranum marinum TaxID=453220 RepID=UPI0029C6CD3D|nr:DUF1254 domain-containing protein [Desulfogranum marinum]
MKVKAIRRTLDRCVMLFFAIILSVTTAHSMGVKEAVSTAMDAYIYGYPLITFDMVRKQETNVAVADGEHAPVGQLIKMRKYIDVDNHCCAAPNQDTLYTIAWLDVEKEPYVLTLPDMGNRYYIMPLLDGYSEVFKVVSSIHSKNEQKKYVITGPGWEGTIPDGFTQVKSPTAMIWLCGRVYCTGTDEDYAAVAKLQDDILLLPLSAYGSTYTPSKGDVDPSFDMETSVRKQVHAMDINTYFDTLAYLMKTNPPKAEDAEMVKRMAKIGLVPGQDFDKEKLGFIDSSLLNTVPKLAQLEMALHLKKQKQINGWLYFTKGVGNYGTDYLMRGAANLLGPGFNRPEDAIYPLSSKDMDGDKYDGSKHDYVIHFDKGGLPPVDGFWSLTMYDKELFLVPNKINRYNISQDDPFITNPDGSVDIYIQTKSPGKGKDVNWLPAPKGKFTLILRVYGPSKSSPSILDGSWEPPPVKRVD